MSGSIKFLVCGAALFFVAASQAGPIGTGSGGVAPEQQAEAVTAVVDRPEVNWRTGTYGPQIKARAASDVSPYGEQLFSGGFRGVRADGINPDYRIAPGDLITLRLWGAVELERVLPVDAQGFIFIPSVGPVRVQGSAQQGLNGLVKSAVQSVYPENVNVYTNLQGVQPVAVFVTGEVENPGRYAGTPNDSLLYFLDQAGGIDDVLGSYRNVKVLRGSKELAVTDLYLFLKEGVLPRIQFQDGDTIVVGRRGVAVNVAGEVEREYQYELNKNAYGGNDLLQYARLKPGVSHVLVRGVRGDEPFSRYFSLAEFSDLILQNGDHVLFNNDLHQDTIVVQVEGSYRGPSRYAVPKDTSLIELLNNVPVTAGITDTSSVSLRRLSVVERQRESLQDSLRRLETTYLGASSSTPQEAEIRIREAELINNFIKRASQIEPNGRMVVADSGRIADIRLQDGDVITIPEETDSILVTGEVLVPQAAVFAAGRSYEDYIERAGGLTQHADEENVVIVRLNGEVVKASDVELRSGDEIIVLPAVPTKNLQLATSISQILYQLAVAAKVAVDL